MHLGIGLYVVLGLGRRKLDVEGLDLVVHHRSPRGLDLSQAHILLLLELRPGLHSVVDLPPGCVVAALVEECCPVPTSPRLVAFHPTDVAVVVGHGGVDLMQRLHVCNTFRVAREFGVVVVLVEDGSADGGVAGLDYLMPRLLLLL
jgi:hypothetical protein